MIYVDLDNAEDAKLINEKIINLKKEKKLIIINNDINKLKKYFNKKKEIIIYNKNNDKLTDYRYFENNIYICNHIDELPSILESSSKKYKYNKTKRIMELLALIIFLLVTIIINNTIIFKDNRVAEKNSSKTTETEKIDESENTKEEIVEEPKEIDDYSAHRFVFYGDSITEMYHLEDYYPGLPVINSGYGGYLSRRLLEEVDEKLLVHNPTKVFMLMGTNDIAYSNFTDEEIVNNMKEIVHKIKEKNPETKIYIESIYPVNETIEIDHNVMHIRTNKRIKDINKKIKSLCKEENITYLNLFDVLKEEDGTINEAYTLEGLHINENGYRVITDYLMKYVKEA